MAVLPVVKRRIPAVEIAGIHIVPRSSRAIRMASPILLIYTDGKMGKNALDVYSKGTYPLFFVVIFAK